ncbi:glycosyltransferase family protein [Methylocaldum marinum]|uniref:Glycosyltransferase family protein n=1 Tax=Methylocaldum marinum TaxID=1432792 RepID=A0A286P448_9GAMM|nr:glycosyltransferase family 4 protein [Methylocaldum marinum]BBA32420.1 glycosyltransferase family protein [Methylocaldum marinum]
MSKRILVISELFLPTKGGTAVWFDEVYRRIGGKEIHIVTADVPGAADHDAGHPNAVHRIKLSRHWWLRPESLAMYAKFLAKSLFLATRHRFDRVDAGRVLPEGLIGWIVARLIRRPLVVYAHGEEITTWRQPAKFRVMCFVYRHADRIIANSEFTRQELVKLGVTSDKISLIYPGVDTDRFRPGLDTSGLGEQIGLKPGERLILSVGRLSRRKGFDQVIRSLPTLVRNGLDVKYAIIGIGEDQKYLAELAKECGVQERVFLLGHVPSEDLPRWYNLAEVFAMPNREINGDTEGFGMVFLEAAACGKPAIAGDAGGTGSAVLHEVTGFRTDGSSVQAISSILGRIFLDAELSTKLGRNAHLRARSEFCWENISLRTAALN